MAEHITRIETPASTTYRDYTVLKPGAWSQGPTLLQALSILEALNPELIIGSEASRHHVILEALKLALADRDEYYGDPEFSRVPLDQLLAKEYAGLRAQLVKPGLAAQWVSPGDPFRFQAEANCPARNYPTDTGTTPLVVADNAGNVVVITFTGCGSQAGSGGTTGVTHGIRLQCFNTWPSHPNCIAPGKRARISTSPTMVLKDGRPMLALSCTTGDMQEQFALQAILGVLDRHLTPQQALLEPKVYTQSFISTFGATQGRSAEILYDDGLDGSVVEELIVMGHQPADRKPRIGRAMLVIGEGSHHFAVTGHCRVL